MAKITWSDRTDIKQAIGATYEWSKVIANEVKTSVNALYDEKLDLLTATLQTIVSSVVFTGQATANTTAADVIKGTTSTPEFDFSKGNDHQMDVESDVSSFTTTNEKGSANYKVFLINDGTPGRTVVAPTGWTADPTSETHTEAADAINLYQFYTLPDGTKYFNIHIVKS